MAQIRFKVEVPGAGSAARNAERSEERFRSLRPEAGSAARRAEEDRRAADGNGAPQRARFVGLRMQGRTGQAPESTANNQDHQPERSAQKGEETSRSFALHPPYPENATPAGGNSGAQSSVGAAPERTLPYPTPLQTATARVRSLLRSVFS